MDITLIRNFRVKGNLTCHYTPDTTTYDKLIANIDIGIWCKAPLEIVQLGSGKTDDNGDFVIDIQLNSPNALVDNGKVLEVFLSASYNGIVLSDHFAAHTIINEGYCDIGDLTLDISDIEIPTNGGLAALPVLIPPAQLNLLFHLTEDDAPLSSQFDLTFTIHGRDPDGDEDVEVVLHTDPNGYVQLNTPLFPVVKVENEILYQVSGPLDARSKECYIKVEASGPAYYYTLITDFVVQDGYLQVFDGDSNFYKVYPNIAVSSKYVALHVTKKGSVYGYSTPDHAWLFLGDIEFTKFQYPDHLVVFSDGFYSLSGTEGTTTTGTLGDSNFADFFGIVLNPVPYLVDVDLVVSTPDTTPVDYNFTNLQQGSLNFTPVDYTGDPIEETDDTPTMADIQSVSGITFSSTFNTFLLAAKIDTLNDARKAGPIKYVDGFPPTGVTKPELSALQGHTDLYSINPDIDQNQHIMDSGFGDIFAIANAPKKVFLDAVVNGTLPLFRAAQIHEVAVQNQKLVGNMLSGLLTDMKMNKSAIDPVDNSLFPAQELARSVNSCGCNDCQSNISPFAYLMDLIRYAAAHIDYSGSPPYTHGGDVDDFITLISGQFLQPFGTLNVDCETLHAEFCRVRLVTEVLEQWVTIQTDGSHIDANRLAVLAQERQQYLLLVYRTILNQAGTSYEELRDIIIKTPADAKTVAEQKLVDRLGIPLIFTPAVGDPYSTIDRMWLTFNGGSPAEQELTAANLETIFGFRDTQRDVLLNTPESEMEQWQAVYLRSTWKSQDYAFTDYSREDLGILSFTYKSNWKPIINPDIIGFTDMTYRLEAGDRPTTFTRAIWRHRKDDTDSFLSYCLSDSTNISRTSADMVNRTLKVTDRNLVSQVIENNEIKIYDGSSWITFTAINRNLVQTDTNVILAKPSPTMFNPDGDTPTMRYKRVLNVTSISGSGTIVLSWPSAVIADALSGGYAKLESDGATQNGPFTTDASSGSQLIVSVVFNDDHTVTLTMGVGADPNASFLAGNIKFVYEVEVPLYTNVMMDPEKIVTQMFTATQDYNFLGTTPSGLSNPFEYNVWDEPSWPSPIDSGLSDYGKLKQLNQLISSGNGTDELYDVIFNNLHMDRTAFNRMMQLLAQCGNYLSAMYMAKEPTESELYELASIFRNSAKPSLDLTWVKEEIEYTPSHGIPTKLMLAGVYFWKSVYEPVAGPWDPSLQTIPASTGDINAFHVPIIDPELLSLDDMWNYPETYMYKDLYTSRQDQLETVFNDFSVFVPADDTGFTEILNEINTNDSDTPYDISPYTSLDDLAADLNSTDAFRIKKASDVLWDAFRFNKDDFNAFNKIKIAYENADPLQAPSNTDIIKAIRMGVSAYKRKQLYPSGASAGWIEEEIEGSFPDGVPVKYYNVLKLRLAAGRTDLADRGNWLHTLEAWNRMPTVQSDIVPPENIIDFSSDNIIYDLWTGYRSNVAAIASDIQTMFNPSLDAGTLFTNLQTLLNGCVGRNETLSVTTGQNYLPYFLKIADMENMDMDIRPYLQQLGIETMEYRYLKRVYDLLEAENISTPTDPSALLDSEYADVTDIFIRIQSVNLTFDDIDAECGRNIILDQDYFRIYEPPLNVFPLTDLPKYNQWRSPYADRKAWLDTLQTRIDREQAVQDKWKAVLQEAEDRNMPLLRDALIRALILNCESFQDAAERLAKTFLIETKDNCCVKHTRVSFAIETLQGLLFTLENGIYDEYVDAFSLFAPNFKQEWQWIGSYTTWRSAMFVFMYPENLLYPTLKRKQSPKFMELADVMANANSLSSNDACDIGKVFSSYFKDICGLKIFFTTTTTARASVDGQSDDCCTNVVPNLERVSYFFGQNYNSLKFYFAIKRHSDPQTGFGFWNEISLPENAQLQGCLPITGSDYYGNYTSVLRLFYTQMDNNELKLAYLKKDLMNPNSDWEEGEEIKIPDLTVSGTVYSAKAVMLSQQVSQDTPVFLVNYGYSTSYSGTTLYLAKYDVSANQLVVSQFSGGTYPVIGPSYPLNTMLKVSVISGGANERACIVGIELGGAYQQVLKVVPIPNPTHQQVAFNVSLPSNLAVYELFRCTQEVSTFIISGLVNGASAIYKVKISINSANDLIAIVTALPGQSGFNILPYFSDQEIADCYVATPYSANYTGGLLKLVGGTSVQLLNGFAPLPIGTIMDIQSADCISDMNMHKTYVQWGLLYNMNVSEGGYRPTDNMGTDASLTLIYEVYYFLPMLIALDQQRRGQFESALSWYRSVYDYTNSVTTNRKIFYGLVLEEFITNSYAQTSDWLLDPLNPHHVAQTRTNAYTKYTLMNIIQCMFGYADREFTLDTIETVPIARKLYTTALELLDVNELRVIEDMCQYSAVACLDSMMDPLPFQRTWSNLYKNVQQQLATLGDATLIDSLADDIADLLNAGDDSTYPDKFAAAFALIESNRPTPPSVLNIAGTMVGYDLRINGAYQYLSAIQQPTAFNESAADRYRLAVARVSGLQPDVVDAPESEDRLSWLTQAVPSNDTSYSFAFAKTDGTQLLAGDDNSLFNPVAPRPVPFAANLNFNNVVSTINIEQLGIPVSYSPLMDYVFCVPSNPIYQALRLKGNVELYKIWNCRNIAGMVRELGVYPSSIDSSTGMPVIGASGTLTLPATGTLAPSQYRFSVLINRAKQIAEQAQQMESLFLAALEKEDAENYNQLRAKQDLETANATIKLQDLRITQAQDERGIADIQLSKATFSQQHYNDLISAGLLDFERKSLDNLQFAEVLQYVAASLDIAAATSSFILGLNGSTAGGLSSLAQASSSVAGALSTQSSILSQLASYQRREQDWQFQSQLAGFDISLANQQIKVSDDNVRIVTQERDIAVLNSTYAQDALEFLKNKFTNAELYNFMSNVLERSYSYMLNLGTAIARTAESQLFFERQEQAGPFILDDYWEAPSTGANTSLSTSSTDRRGLTGSARLLVDITRLDQYAFDTAKRKLQMTKVISLAQNFPSEFQAFKETGIMNFELTNKFFDYDFPGHYLRLVNSVKTTVVGLIPVYDQIRATLTADTTSYTVIGGTTFQRTPIRRAELDSVALTGATNATGMFELQQTQSDLLNPFEGMGIESRWEFKMPQFSNRFDYTNIADVLITVEYTALDSDQYRQQVLHDLDDTFTFNRGFSFKNNFPDQWFELGEAESGPNEFGVTIQLKRELFPQGIDNLQLNTGENLVLYFVRADGFTGEIDIHDFSKVTNGSSGNSYSGTTVGGRFDASQMMTTLGTSPVVSLQLFFDNTQTNRALFSDEKVTDILLLVPCKATLRSYPL